MTPIQKPLAELSEEVIDVLVQQFGLADTVRFLRQFTGGLGDYTRDRQAQPDEKLEDVLAAIRARRNAASSVASTVSATKDSSAHAERLRTIRERHQRAYAPWTPDEEEELVEKYEAGEHLDALADHFGRQPSAIRSRLQKLGLMR